MMRILRIAVVVSNFDHELGWRTVKADSNYIRNRFRTHDAIDQLAFNKNFIAHLMHAILPSTNILVTSVSETII